MTQITDMDFCQNLVREQDPDRYLTCLFAGHQVRPALFSLYAFNYELAKTRETVSDPTLGEIRLAWWRETIEDLAQGKVREHPVAASLAAMEGMTEHIPDFLTLIEARRLDIYESGPANMGDLTEYVFDTGGTLTRLAGRMENPTISDTAQDALKKIGAAWAMLGLVRACAWQAMDTHFLPHDALSKDARPEGGSAEQTGAVEAVEQIEPILNTMTGKAGEWLQTAKELCPKGTGTAFLIGTSARRYLRFLDKHGPKGMVDRGMYPSSPVHILSLALKSVSRNW